MRLCLFVVLAVSCLELVCCNVRTSVGNGTDIEELYARLLERMIQALEDLEKKSEDPTPEDKDRASCIYALNAVSRNLKSSWALAMIDSGSKLPSGVLNGNLMDLGSYDQCIKVSTKDTDDPNLPSFTGRHCLITNNIYLPNGTIVLNGKKQNLRDLFGNSFIPVTLAQCFPSLCKPQVIEEGLNAVFSVADNALDFLGVGFGVNVTVDPMDCHDVEGVPYDILDWVVLAFILLLLTLGVISTAVDYFYIKLTSKKKPSSFTMRILGSFSYYTNGNKLLSQKMVGDAIPSLNGLKFFSMCWVVLGHRFMYVPREPVRNYIDIPELLKGIGRMVIVNGPMAVDTFFLISGMLNMYGFLHGMAKSKKYTIKDVLNGYVHRYLRLTPSYLMMIGFTATWMYRLRDGPLWDRFVGDYKEACREGYWINLIYINNYFRTENYCMMQSWYLAADMQLFWLSPLMMYPLWRWPKYGWAQLFVLTLASIASPFLVSWYGHIASPIPVTSDTTRRAREMKLLYFPMHTKSVSYVLGIGAGYILYKYRKGKLSLQFSLWKRVIGWLVCATCMLYAVFGGYEVYQMDQEYNQPLSAFFIGFQRFFWSSGLLWLILMCVREEKGFINTFLSWKVFTPLARLSYCVYLTHIVILMCGIAAQRSSFFYSDYDQIERYLGDLVLCMFSGLVLTLLVEAPMMNIEKIILGGGGKKPKNEIPRPSAPPQEGHLHVA